MTPFRTLTTPQAAAEEAALAVDMRDITHAGKIATYTKENTGEGG
jgi:hypothetical protein